LQVHLTTSYPFFRLAGEIGHARNLNLLSSFAVSSEEAGERELRAPGKRWPNLRRRNDVKQLSRRQALQTGLAGAFAVGASPLSTAAHPALKKQPITDFSFHHDHIIGTSFDAWLQAASQEDADRGEQAMLDEIERLRLVFSTYDPTSEISWLNRTSGPTSVSADMAAVLKEYEFWGSRSSGALSAQVGGFVHAWKEAQAAGKTPGEAWLADMVEQARRPGWEMDETTGILRRLTDQPLNLNSIAKGYIIQNAAQAARAAVPSLRAVLVNIGGDMLGWQKKPSPGWLIGVQDPFRPEENAPPLTVLRLSNAAIATSGGYQRYYSIGDRRHSHLLDPRTGQPALGIASATVVAETSVVANALATTLCILPVHNGLKLVAELPGVECLLVAAEGRQWRSAGFQPMEMALAAETKEAAEAKAADAWPEDFQVSINIDLPKLNVQRYRRPYVAVWIENQKGKPVRSLTVWGNAPKYWPALPAWWKFNKDDKDLIKSVTRATREPGKYEVAWDGKDDKGEDVPQGTYVVRVEVHREHGQDLIQTGKIACAAKAAKASMARNAETGLTSVVYDKKK
jgi:thiamine biosynthesis lipoprotein